MRASEPCMRLLLLFVVLAALTPAKAVAQLPQEPPIGSTDLALRPPDTSSPRDTLRSYLSESGLAIEGLLGGEPDQLAISRATATMDFSTTVHGNTWEARIRSLVLLHEILNRITIPSNEDIPGDDEVSDGEIVEWRIPDTSITIARITQGPRMGDFVFSANTVGQLEAFYRQVDGLPAKPGGTVGAYEVLFGRQSEVTARQGSIQERLRPVDTSNPLATFEGFLGSVNRAYALVMEGQAADDLTTDELLAIERTAANFLQRAALTLDLSKVPEALRRDLGIETALQLKEIFDRMSLPPLDAIPDAEVVEAARKGESLSLWAGSEPLRWRYPNTEIEIVEATEGERQGQFLFSARTVRQMAALYKKVEDLPYRLTQSGYIELKYNSPELSPGFFDLYTASPGKMIADASILGELVSSLPDWLKARYGGQTLWKWIGLLISFLVAAIAAYLILFVFGRRLSSDGSFGFWLTTLPPFFVAILVFFIGRFIDEDLNITGPVLAFVAATATLIILAMVAWSVYLLCNAAAETAIASRRIRDVTSDATMLRISARVVGFLLATGILIWGIRHLGADLIPLLAGLGVGGLAVALAAQRTFANLIGSVILFVNKPVRVGDFCRYGDQIGTVESMGLIATRIRSLERTIVTVPNAEFSEMQIDNFTARDERLLKTLLQLRYETTPEQMRYVLGRLREMLLGHPKVSPEPARVRFSSFGAYSKDIEMFAYLRCQDQDAFCAIREDIFLRIDEIVAESGTGFAFPSQTAYLTRDQGLDTEMTEEATRRVKEWRARKKLPFPDFDEEERERLEDTLDYPPRGSPDHESRL